MDIIQKYAQAGYALFQLNGKKPVAEGVDWSQTPVDPTLDRADFPGNYGVVAAFDYRHRYQKGC